MALQGTALALSRCELFKDFSETGLAILATIAAERPVPAGVPIFVEGMASDALFVVKSGKVRILVRDAEGNDQPIGVAGEGDPLGQLALLLPSGARMVSAVATEGTQLLEIRSRDFQRLQGQKPQACLKLMMAIAAQLGRSLGDNRELFRAALSKAK